MNNPKNKYQKKTSGNLNTIREVSIESSQRSNAIERVENLGILEGLNQDLSLFKPMNPDRIEGDQFKSKIQLE